MSDLAQVLVSEFERANDQLLDVVARCSEEQWRSICLGEVQPVGVTAHHIAYWYPTELRYIRAIADGTPLAPMQRDDLDAANAEHGRRYARCSKEEVGDLLRRNVDEVVATIGDWNEERLERSGTYVADGAPGTVADLIERVLIGHPRAHLRAIREATGL